MAIINPDIIKPELPDGGDDVGGTSNSNYKIDNIPLNYGGGGVFPEPTGKVFDTTFSITLEKLGYANNGGKKFGAALPYWGGSSDKYLNNGDPRLALKKYCPRMDETYTALTSEGILDLDAGYHIILMQGGGGAGGYGIDNAIGPTGGAGGGGGGAGATVLLMCKCNTKGDMKVSISAGKTCGFTYGDLTILANRGKNGRDADRPAHETNKNFGGAGGAGGDVEVNGNIPDNVNILRKIKGANGGNGGFGSTYAYNKYESATRGGTFAETLEKYPFTLKYAPSYTLSEFNKRTSLYIDSVSDKDYQGRGGTGGDSAFANGGLSYYYYETGSYPDTTSKNNAKNCQEPGSMGSGGAGGNSWDKGQAGGYGGDALIYIWSKPL